MKLTSEQAREIRRIWNARPTGKTLAEKYGVSVDWIRKIVQAQPRRKVA